MDRYNVLPLQRNRKVVPSITFDREATVYQFLNLNAREIDSISQSPLRVCDSLSKDRILYCTVMQMSLELSWGRTAQVNVAHETPEPEMTSTMRAMVTMMVATMMVVTMMVVTVMDVTVVMVRWLTKWSPLLVQLRTRCYCRGDCWEILRHFRLCHQLCNPASQIKIASPASKVASAPLPSLARMVASASLPSLASMVASANAQQWLFNDTRTTRRGTTISSPNITHFLPPSPPTPELLWPHLLNELQTKDWLGIKTSFMGITYMYWQKISQNFR